MGCTPVFSNDNEPYKSIKYEKTTGKTKKTISICDNHDLSHPFYDWDRVG